MNGVHEFSGIKNVEAVRFILEQYDNDEFPINSGWSYTRYYFTRAWDNGWRFAYQASNVWNAFEEIRNDNTSIPDQIYMTHLSSAINYIFLTYGNIETIAPILAVNEWKEAFDFVELKSFPFSE